MKLSSCFRRSMIVRSLTFLILFHGLYIRLPAQTMMLIAPRSGWVVRDDRLFLTKDNGVHWRDSTPRAPDMPSSAILNNVFFHNGDEGWVLMSYPETLKGSTPQRESSPKLLYRLFHTENGATSWSSTPVIYPELPEWIAEAFAGPTSLYFLDAAHGWISVALSGLQAPGRLLATNDGGRTWAWIKSPPHSGSILFITPSDGWLISNSGSDELYATHDGCESWQKVTLPNPPNFASGMRVKFGTMPRFDDASNGHLVVEYSGSGGAASRLVIYNTKSGGMTWEIAKQIDVPAGTAYALTDSSLVLPVKAADQPVATGTVSLAGSEAAPRNFSNRGILSLSFVDKDNGWLTKADGTLFETSDGGTSWTQIKLPSRRPLAKRKFKSNSLLPGGLEIMSSATMLTAASGGSSAAHLSKHLGFDAKYVMNADPNMSAWWKYSPYYDTSLYLPGAVNRKNDPLLNAPWVTSVQAQGWGLIPVWVGPQAPCVQGSYYTFDPSTAGAQGKKEADSAAAAASTFGLAKSVVYYDMELYDTTNTTCSAAVTAFVGAWVSELHGLGYKAGVYANPTPAQQDISIASPIPDAIWVAKYAVAPSPGQATIWGLGALTDAPWASNQRIHQYLNYPIGSTGESYDGYANVIDRDIDDAQVAGSSGVKTYTSWTINLIDYPDNPTNTALWAANDKYMGQPGSYEPPLVTGQYCYQCNFNSNGTGFWWDNGAFNDIASFANYWAQPFAVNNSGVVVGRLYGISCCGETGFTLNTVTGSQSFVTVPSSWNALTTTPNGLNDAGEVSGVWTDSSNNAHGFIADDNGNWMSVDHSGTKSTSFQQINGLGQVAGFYIDSKNNTHGFIYSKLDGFTDINCSGAPSTVLTGINNNGQVTGFCGTSVFLYDLAHGTYAQVQTVITFNDMQPFAVNDENVPVGRCQATPCTNGEDGFYALPQP